MTNSWYRTWRDVTAVARITEQGMALADQRRVRAA
jgi:hypothetical protein